MNTIIIGIAGGTGSGKTTLTERLRDHFGIDEVSVINHDSYYKRHDELPYEERCKLNYDHPDSFDTPADGGPPARTARRPPGAGARV